MTQTLDWGATVPAANGDRPPDSVERIEFPNPYEIAADRSDARRDRPGNAQLIHRDRLLVAEGDTGGCWCKDSVRTLGVGAVAAREPINGIRQRWPGRDEGPQLLCWARFAPDVEGSVAPADNAIGAQREADADRSVPNRSTKSTVTEERITHGVCDRSAIQNPAVQNPGAP